MLGTSRFPALRNSWVTGARSGGSHNCRDQEQGLAVFVLAVELGLSTRAGVASRRATVVRIAHSALSDEVTSPTRDDDQDGDADEDER